MVVELTVINQVLDIILKLLFIGGLVYLVFVLRNLDDMIESAERSAESIEKTAEDIGKIVQISRYLPFIGRRPKDE